MSTWYRLCYRFDHWTPGHCLHKDGFARDYWKPDKAEVEQAATILRDRGGDVRIEEREFK